MKRILLVSPFQYGYHTDMDMYFKYLSKTFEVIYLCVDHQLPKISHKGKVIYIKDFKAGLLTKVLLLFMTFGILIINKPHFAIVTYFRGCSIIARIFNKRHIIVDIRTGSVLERPDRRNRMNRRIAKEANRFPHIMVVSEGLAKMLGLKGEKTFVVPLGADTVIDKTSRSGLRDGGRIHLLYVGTFDGRNIKETIKGFNLFYQKYKYDISCRYTLIGYSQKSETVEAIRKEIVYNGLHGVVNYLGRIPHPSLKPHLESHNIGVSFVPQKECYAFQPPTKTYEYLKNGLICIATRTHEHEKVIKETNGVLIEDNCFSFFKGLEAIYHKLESYDADNIMASVNSSWQSIVNHCLISRLEKIQAGGE